MTDNRAPVGQPRPQSTEDNLRVYLREMGLVPLLKRRDEIALARRMERGQRRVLGALAQCAAVREGLPNIEKLSTKIDSLANRLPRLKPGGAAYRRTWWACARGRVAASRELRAMELSPTSVNRLTRTVLEGAEVPVWTPRILVGLREIERAKDELIRSNLRLVVSIAKKCANRGVSFLDLIQEGNIGLMRAVDKFEYRRGYKFSTYATWWIRQAVSRAISDQSRTVRVPVHMNEIIHRIARTQARLVQRHGREPTPEEIAGELGISLAKVRKGLRIGRVPVSLDKQLEGNDGMTIKDLIEDSTSRSPLDEALRTDLEQRTQVALDSLSPREARIIRMRFGVGGGRQHTLDEVGRCFTLTRERIRQIESRALDKLRRHAPVKALRDLVD